MAFTGGTGADQYRPACTCTLKAAAGAKVSVGRGHRPTAAKDSRTFPGPRLFLRRCRTSAWAAGTSKAQYQYTLQSADLQELNDWAPRVLAKMRKLPGAGGREQRPAEQGLQELARHDRDTASRLGLSAADIDNTLYDAFGQRQVSTMYTPLNQYHVVMEVAPQYWQDPDS